MHNPSQERAFGLSSFWMKVIACLLMTLDHIALLFIPLGSSMGIPLPYYLLRAIGKMAFPIFAFLAVEGAYKTKNIKWYLLRLGGMALLLDGIGYAFGGIFQIKIADNPLIGNAFTDMFLGVLTITLLRMKNRYSLLAVLPILYAVFSDFTISDTYGTLFKSDWGTFSICLFVAYFIFRELADVYAKRKSQQYDVPFTEESIFRLEKDAMLIGLILVEAIFYLIYRIDRTCFIIPNEFVPIGTYSTLAGVILFFYNGKKGYSSKYIQYGFYLYYPLHLLVLGIISMFCGVLAGM